MQRGAETSTPLAGQFGDSDPVWSPAGGSIAFVRNGDIWTMGEDGGSPTRITQVGGSSEPAFGCRR